MPKRSLPATPWHCIAEHLMPQCMHVSHAAAGLPGPAQMPYGYSFCLNISLPEFWFQNPGKEVTLTA